jgi:hypothetical protein
MAVSIDKTGAEIQSGAINFLKTAVCADARDFASRNGYVRLDNLPGEDVYNVGLPKNEVRRASARGDGDQRFGGCAWFGHIRIR